MRKKVVALVLTVSLMGAFSLAPGFIAGTIPTVDVTSALHSTYRQSVQCDGTVALNDVKKIYMQYPVIAGEIDVQPGDYVVKGQRLFTVNKEATVSAITQLLSQMSAVPGFLNLEGLAEALGSALSGSDAVNLSAIPDAIYSAENGYLRELNVSKTALFNYSLPVATVSEDKQQIVKLNIPESVVYQIGVGNDAIVTGLGTNASVQSGTVTSVADAAVTVFNGLSSSKAIETVVSLNQSDGPYITGTSVKVTIFTEQPRSIISIPYEAVDQNAKGEEFVRCVVEGKVVYKPIVTGDETEDGFEVSTGLDGNELLVLNGQGLKEGQLVITRRGGEEKL